MSVTTSPKNHDELRILTPIGMLGYGYDENLFFSAVHDGVDAIICDSGSTDGGPNKLALGKTTCPTYAYQRDLKPFVEASHKYRVPVIIGSAGGDGSNDHVELLASIVEQIVKDSGFRTMNIVKIYSELDKSVILHAHRANRIRPCGSSVPTLTAREIDDAVRVVAQMGHEPFLEAMKCVPEFDIIIGGRAYDPAMYAAFCVYKGFNDLGVAYHMGKIMECGALCAIPKSKEALAIVRHGSFDVVPLDQSARCTAMSVAAHSLYEKARPDILIGPGGALCLEHSTYEELPDGRSVRVQGARFETVKQGEYTVKLEGARCTGYRSAFFGGMTDPILISQIDSLLSKIKEYVATKCTFPYELRLVSYGNGNHLSMFNQPTIDNHLPSSIAISGQAKAATQERANQVISTARIASIHGPYPGQKANAGNLAMLYQGDIPLGEACEFCVYHLMTIKDPVTPFHREVKTIRGLNHEAGTHRLDIEQAEYRQPTSNKATTNFPITTRLSSLTPPAKPGYCYLGEFASIVRSKNAGPYEVTFDIMFDSHAKYTHVRESGALTESIIVELLGVKKEDVIAALWWNQALAFKFTTKRPIVSGSFGDLDTHASCQHVPLLYLQIPLLKNTDLELCGL